MDEIAVLILLLDMRKAEGFSDETLIVLPVRERRRLESDPESLELYFTDLGFFPTAAGHYRERPRGCPQSIVILCAGGRGFCLQGGRRLSVGPMERLVIPAGSPHVYWADERDPWTIFWVHIAGTKAVPMLGEGGGASVGRISAERAEKAQRAFGDLISLVEGGPPSQSPRLISSALRWLLALLADPGSDAGRSARPVPEDRAMEYMRSRLSDPPSLAELCAVAELSPSQLTVRFRRRTGYPPLAYFARMRMLEACTLLSKPDAKVAEVAEALGYEDPLHFSRVFRRVIGMPPRVYRDEPRG